MDVNVCVLGRMAVPGRIGMRLPSEKGTLWQKLWETEAKSLDDCKVSGVETGIEAVDRFLRGIDLYRVDIFELNVFARKLEDMREREKQEYGRRLEQERPDSLKAAIYSTKMEVPVT